MQQLNHPNIHREWSQWSEDQTLHVTSVYFNPFRYQNRRHTTHNFIQRMRKTPNVKLYMIEVAFGDRPFEVTGPEDIQLRTRDEMWIKENASNLGVARFTDGWKYGAAVDCDFVFTRHDWALETIHMLQHFKWVQPYSSYGFMSREHEPINIKPSFAYAFQHYHEEDPARQVETAIWQNTGNTSYPPYGHRLVGSPGGAWAFTRESFDAVHGMPDFCILGSGDWHMAFGFLNRPAPNHDDLINGMHGPYARAILDWQAVAGPAVNADIGYVRNFAIHEWHGDVRNRGYSTRGRILQENRYDPFIDITKDYQGVLRWTGRNPKLETAVRRYFMTRDEDSTERYTRTLIQA
jgi:hypothetical protein